MGGTGVGEGASTVRPLFATPAQVVGAGERGEVILLPPPPQGGGGAGVNYRLLRSPGEQVLSLGEVYCD